MKANGDFSQLLRYHRNRAGQTQQQLADLSAMSIRAVRDLELGRVNQPRRETVRLLADGLRLEGRTRAEFEAAAGHQATVGDLKSIYDATPPSPPAPLDSLIGRDAEVGVLEELLATGCQRLVTITGLSGVGKTRVALEVAGNLHSSRGFPVLWNSSSDLAAPSGGTRQSDQLSALINAGLDELLGTTDEGALDELMTLIGERPSLLLLDGYQAESVHVERIVPLLEACAGLRTLITSRLPFGVRGERAFQLAPLPVPEPGGGEPASRLEEMASVQLLLRYVRQAVPQFDLTDANADAFAELCHRLDGIPVALAAAASWFLVYEPEALLGHVRTDPFDFVARANDPDGSPQLRELLDRTVDSLAPLAGRVLATLVRGERSWTVTEVAELTGVSDADCAGAVRDLLALGVLRAVADERSKFRVLDLVRFLHATPGGRQRHRQPLHPEPVASALPAAS